MDKNDLYRKWNFLGYQSRDHFKTSSMLQYHAIQFIAIAGRYLCLSRNNDEKLSMQWYLNKCMLIGCWIDAKSFPLKIGLRLTDLKLMILNPSFSEVASMNMQGSTKEEVFEWLSEKLKSFGAEPGKMKMELYYQLPEHETDNGEPFQISSKEEMIELSNLRTNADLLLRYYNSFFENEYTISVWPQNFDMGFQVPLQENKKGQVTKSLKTGLSIPDSFVDHYYFYVSHHDINDSVDYDKIRKLEGGGFWTTQSRMMAVLPLYKLHQLKTKQEQVDTILSFYTSALNNTFDMMLYPEFKIGDTG